MIFCFSGTGNSRFVAERIAAHTGDAIVSANDLVRRGGTQKFEGTDRVVFVTPTYAWRIPRVVRDLILRTDFGGARNAYFVMTCGGEIGNAAKYNIRLCAQKGFAYRGTAQILMPENYIAMFGVPEKEEANAIITRALPDIASAAERIYQNADFPKPRNSFLDRAMSRFVNPIFYRLFVKADAFYAKDGCVGCGKCASLCPLGNIRMRDGKPVWGKNCTHCMACICSCPTGAIEYGKKSVGKPRYLCRYDEQK